MSYVNLLDMEADADDHLDESTRRVIQALLAEAEAKTSRKRRKGKRTSAVPELETYQDFAEHGGTDVAPKQKRRKKAKRRAKRHRNEWRPPTYGKEFTVSKPCCVKQCFVHFEKQVRGWRADVCEDKSITPHMKIQQAQGHFDSMILSTGETIVVVVVLVYEI